MPSMMSSGSNLGPATSGHGSYHYPDNKTCTVDSKYNSNISIYNRKFIPYISCIRKRPSDVLSPRLRGEDVTIFCSRHSARRPQLLLHQMPNGQMLTSLKPVTTAELSAIAASKSRSRSFLGAGSNE